MEKDKLLHYEITEATPEDIEPIRRMHAKSWLAAYPNDEHNISYDWVKRHTDGWFEAEKLAESKEILAGVLGDPAHYYRFASEGGAVVGFVHAKKDDVSAELEAIYTDPATFGSGLGQKLMDGALEWLGGARVGLTVVSYNQRAIQFYERNGFSVVAGTEQLHKDKLPVVRMIRKGDEDEV